MTSYTHTGVEIEVGRPYDLCWHRRARPAALDTTSLLPMSVTDVLYFITCICLSRRVVVTIRAGARDISSDGVATIARLRSTTMVWRHFVADPGEGSRVERRSRAHRLSFGDS